MTIKKWFWLTALVLFSVSMPSAASEKRSKLVLSGPFAGVSNPLIHMVETGALKEFADVVEFKPWNGADQLKLMALGKGNFQADFIAMPSNVAANLYNRGVNLKLMNISVWGILWMVSRDNNLKTLADFKGQEIAMPFRGDMPDIVFEQLVKAEGLDPKKDFKLRYTPHPLDAMQLLIMRRVDHALLPEPAISMALQRTQSFPINVIAPDLYRSVDLQEEWGRLFKRESKISEAGMTAMASVLDDPALLKRFNEAYAESMQWCLDNPKKASEMVVKYISLLTSEAVEDSIEVTHFDVKSAQAAKPDLIFFYEQLMQNRPDLVGGKFPDNGFYYAP